MAATLSDVSLSHHFLGQPVFLLSLDSICKDTHHPHKSYTQVKSRYPDHAQATAGSSTPVDYESALSLYGRAYLWEGKHHDDDLVERRTNAED